MIKRGEIHMSRKNHQMVNGQLLQMDKQYSALKQKQKEKIALWMYEETYAYYLQYHKMPRYGYPMEKFTDTISKEKQRSFTESKRN